jgi:hypothetical protein
MHGKTSRRMLIYFLTEHRKGGTIRCRDHYRSLFAI